MAGHICIQGCLYLVLIGVIAGLGITHSDGKRRSELVIAFVQLGDLEHRVHRGCGVERAGDIICQRHFGVYYDATAGRQWDQCIRSIIPLVQLPGPVAGGG